jgi:solute carrier family 25 aspartate/glutamate transporter 12/13
MANVQAMKESVKESLLGSEQSADVQLSAQSKAIFDKNVRKDPETGELIMTEEEFVNAVAPPGEDYVSPVWCSCCTRSVSH